MKAARPVYRRILLKLSGEALAGKAGAGLDVAVCTFIAAEIAAVRSRGVEIGIVIGGGNFLRGASVKDVPRVNADAMGMLATAINSLSLQSYLVRAGCPCRVLTARRMDGVGECFSAGLARECLGSGEIVIIAGGTGNPYFTTDTAAALRCAEIGAEALLKATKVDGVYDRDPLKYPGAKKFDRLSHAEALQRRLGVMDATAFSFCQENNIPIIVFKLSGKGNLQKCIEGRATGSLITAGGT